MTLLQHLYRPSLLAPPLPGCRTGAYPALGRHSMKRSLATAKQPKPKRAKTIEPDYCSAPTRRDASGASIWPSGPEAIEQARSFLRDCAAKQSRTLIVPDKDADGLSSGIIVYRSLLALGLAEEHLAVHLLQKHASVHDENERRLMQEKRPRYIIVVDHGSRAAPPLVDNPNTKSLLIDHHLSDEFPERATVVSACHYPPVATSSLLTYEICKALDPSIAESCALLCVIGTHGDLGNTLKWHDPFPDMSQVFKTHTKKAVSDAISLLNAPRRTAEFDVISAWDALLKADSPQDVLKSSKLLQARQWINEEVEFRTHTPPKFTKDGKIAVFRIYSTAQVHGVIATRWAGHLNSKALEIIMVANSGYRPGFVNFSCRIARSARAREPPVNIIESLKAAAALDEGDLLERMGESFARGHKEASGGIVPAAEFEELMKLLRVGEKPDRKPGDSPSKSKVPQKNNLMNYFGKAQRMNGTTAE